MLVSVALRRVRERRGLTFRPRDVWVAGDTPHDLACARAAGVRCALVATGHHSLEELGRLGPDTLVATLVSLAREALPAGTFEVADAARLDPGELVDAVVSCGMFPYLPSLDYARGVVGRMAGKARRAVAILDIPDRAPQELALRYRKAAAQNVRLSRALGCRLPILLHPSTPGTLARIFH